MLRSQMIIPCALGALAVASMSFGSGPAATAQLQQKNMELELLKARVEVLETKLEEFTEFAEAQADAGAALEKALSESEAAGFTAGINPKSREVLLSGLRGAADAMQAAPTEDAKDKKAPAGRRRGIGRGGR